MGQAQVSFQEIIDVWYLDAFGRGPLLDGLPR